MQETAPSLRRATPDGVVWERARFSIEMQPLTGLYLLHVIPFCLIPVILIRKDGRRGDAEYSLRRAESGLPAKNGRGGGK
jgi:hypothetical protein